MLQNQMQVREQHREAVKGSLTKAQKEQIRAKAREGSRETTREMQSGNGGNGAGRKGQ